MTTTTKNAEGFYATACMSFWMVMAIGTQITDDLWSFRLLLHVYHYTMILCRRIDRGGFRSYRAMVLRDGWGLFRTAVIL